MIQRRADWQSIEASQIEVGAEHVKRALSDWAQVPIQSLDDPAAPKIDPNLLY